jgi:hypothetical protein
MAIWFRNSSVLNSDIIRQAAKDAGVSWECQTVQYKNGLIGYSDADASDTSLIESEIEKSLNHTPIQIDASTVETIEKDR